MKRSLIVLALGLSLGLSTTQLAFADQSAAIENAQAVLKEADALFDAKDFENARLKYATAYGLVPSVDILWSLAVSEYESGHYPDALRRFRQYIREAKARPPRVEDAKHDYIPKALSKTGHIEVVAPDGAAIYVDGKYHAGNAPLADPIDVSPGVHEISAKVEGKPQASTTANANAGLTVQVSLLGGTSAQRPDQGNTIDPNKPVDGAVDLGQPNMTKRNVTSAILVGGGAVAVGVGIIFGLQSRSDRDSAAVLRLTAGGCQGSSSAACAELADTTSAQSRNATLSDVFIIGGAVVAAAGVVTFLLWPKPKTSAAWVRPSVTPVGSSLVVGGSF